MHSNHHHHHRSPPPPSTGKPPRPPPSPSVSVPSDPDPPTQPYTHNNNESPRSPLRSESPIRSDDPDNATSAPQTAVLAVEKYYSPLTSPLPPPPSSPPLATMDPITQDNLHHMISFNRREEVPPATGVVKRVGFRDLSSGGGGGGGDGGVVGKVGLGFRVLEVVVCLVSFSVMASDKTQGWSGDSFDRYNEYRFCLTVTIMGFVYSGFQAFDLAYHMSTGKHVITHHLRYQFDFIADQILAYLLISASSAAATRVNDWVLNWGKDAFTQKASASISMAFIAFICSAISSLISGYNLCNHDIS